MSPINLLFSFSGRIPRSHYWIGFVILLVLAVIGFVFTADPRAFDLEAPTPPPTMAQNIFALLLLVPSIAIVLKRLNDRDWPSWTIWIVVLVCLPLYIGPFFGMFVDFENLSAFEWTAAAAFLIVSLWLFVENGFFKGTDGHNQYGPDPLANT